MTQSYKVLSILSVTHWGLKAFGAAALSFTKGYLCWKRRDPKSKKDPTLRSVSYMYIYMCMCVSVYIYMYISKYIQMLLCHGSECTYTSVNYSNRKTIKQKPTYLVPAECLTVAFVVKSFVFPPAVRWINSVYAYAV